MKKIRSNKKIERNVERLEKYEIIKEYNRKRYKNY